MSTLPDRDGFAVWRIRKFVPPPFLIPSFKHTAQICHFSEILALGLPASANPQHGGCDVCDSWRNNPNSGSVTGEHFDFTGMPIKCL